MKAPKKRKQITTILVTVGLAVIAVGIFVIASRNSAYKQGPTTSPSPSVTRGNSTEGEPSPSPTVQASSRPETSPSGWRNATVAKPVLQKSSGNAPGSSVPAGAMMEFTCEGTAGLDCELVLTNRNNAAQVVSLGKKTIASNGRGQNFATWEWSAVKGSWNVTARATDASGNSATSDAQTLEVK